MSDPLFQTWASDAEKNKVYDLNNLDGYDGAVYRSQAHYPTNYSRQTYIDIEPNRSVRPSFSRSDYDSFRPGEAIPTKQKRIMGMCMSAYDRVGIIRNVIDLMSDFASQGLVLVHPNKNIEKFYRKWFNQVRGTDRSERFLNYLYRTGNVVVKRRTAKLNKKKEADLRRAAGADVEIESMTTKRREVPWIYDFLNPLAVDVKDPGMYAIGKPSFVLKISKYTYQSLLKSSQNNKSAFKTLPSDIQRRVESGDRTIPLDPESTFFYHYKKDDWLLWANPMIYAILDDISMLEKMKLADLAALDGAISSVRLWTLGDFDQKIVPTKAGLNKVRDILASNVGGGTMDLVWGPELRFTESQSQVYKFLGSEKYQPVLTSIYAGLGIPPTLTGASGASGGYTNNYVSLKTLIERLEYGREVLAQFWRQEIEYVRRAMGFRLPAEIHFDSIVLSDEAAQKNLLIQLADRDIISQETLLERFREIPNIEKVRVRREERTRMNDSSAPKKAGPYHNPQHREDVVKIGLTKDKIDTEEYFERLDIPHVPEEEPVEPPKEDPNNQVEEEVEKEQERVEEPGRPPLSRDVGPRKQKRVLPRSGEATSATLWAISAQKKISDIMTPIACSHFKKKDARALSKAEVTQLEYLKLCILTGMKPFVEVTPELVKELVEQGTKPSKTFNSLAENNIENFSTVNSRKPNTSELRHIHASVYAQLSCF
tara:strand:+ start:8713 stop:10842 length:2130 start_codon:yes stop_codon:yes gene_type:complete